MCLRHFPTMMSSPVVRRFHRHLLWKKSMLSFLCMQTSFPFSFFVGNSNLQSKECLNTVVWFTLNTKKSNRPAAAASAKRKDSLVFIVTTVLLQAWYQCAQCYRKVPLYSLALSATLFFLTCSTFWAERLLVELAVGKQRRWRNLFLIFLAAIVTKYASMACFSSILGGRYIPHSYFLPAAKPSGPRTVQVVLLVVGGSSLMLTFGWVMSFLFPTYNFLRGGIHHSLTRFLFGVGSFISFSSHVFAAAGRWTKSALVNLKKISWSERKCFFKERRMFLLCGETLYYHLRLYPRTRLKNRQKIMKLLRRGKFCFSFQQKKHWVEEVVQKKYNLLFKIAFSIALLHSPLSLTNLCLSLSTKAALLFFHTSSFPFTLHF